ncbi:MAG: VCBS repeat-containing protein, partial [Acidobacteriota bacterium]|nr:VCBS repeat-containing protein [Acidobacteriota bacterium]
MARSRKKKKRAGEVRISTATPNAMAPAKAGSAVRSAGTALRWILGLATVSGVALVLWWGGGSDGPAPEAPAPTAVQAPSQSAGHLRMLTELAAIRDRTADVNQWQGDAKARQARSLLSRLPAEGLELERFQLLTDVGEHELRLGNETDAIDRFATAVELLPTLEGTLSENQALRTVFRLGVAYLRYGETQNCTQRHNADSCILPIRGDGVHTDETGSRAAIDAFLHVLEGTQRTDPLHIKSVWLLNLAYMTVGGYPDEVPPDYRLAPDVFESEESFPRFVNVAARLGLADFTLSGGTVFDDFDGDDDLDLVTTTFDAFGEPRFYRNRGDGNFDDRSGAANLKGLYGGLNLVQADYDNDGDLDIYVLRGAWLASAGRQPNSLWRNDGTGRFADVTFEAGLGETALPAQSAAWADYDNDGDVDLFVGNEHGTPPAGMGLDEEPFDAPSELFRNNG